VGTGRTPPQAAEKSNYSADTPSSPEEFASELWNLDLHEHCADLDAWRAAAEKLISERDRLVRAEARAQGWVEGFEAAKAVVIAKSEGNIQ